MGKRKFFCYDTNPKNNLDLVKELSEIKMEDLPFGGVTATETLLFSDPGREFMSEGESLAVSQLGSFEIVAGNKYKVVFDGVEYVCTAATPFTDVIIIGNGDIMEPCGIGNGEPFVMSIENVPNVGVTVLIGTNILDPMTHSIEVYAIEEDVTKLSGKYVEGMGWSEVTKSHSDTLTWDGVGSADDPSGEVYGNLITYHRVSDDVPSVEQLSAGGIYTLCQNSEFMDTEFTSSDVQDNTSVGFIVVGPVIIACADNVTAQGLTFPKAGIYFMSMPEEYASGFKVNGYQFETETETIHPIDPKFLGGQDYYYFSTPDCVLYKNVALTDAVTIGDMENVLACGKFREVYDGKAGGNIRFVGGAFFNPTKTKGFKVTTISVGSDGAVKPMDLKSSDYKSAAPM